MTLCVYTGPQQIQTLTVEDGQRNVTIPCDLQREQSPFWFVNGSAYGLMEIPLDFPSIPEVNSYIQLTIPIVTRELNNTIFQCASFDAGGLVLGSPFELIVSS